MASTNNQSVRKYYSEPYVVKKRRPKDNGPQMPDVSSTSSSTTVSPNTHSTTRPSTHSRRKPKTRFKGKRRKKLRNSILTIVILFALLASLYMGYYCQTFVNYSRMDAGYFAGVQFLLGEISKQNIRENILRMMRFSDLAGTPTGAKLTEYLKNSFKEHGLEAVKVYDYRPVLSYPDLSKPSTIAIVKNNATVFNSFHHANSYNAYSPTATSLKGDLIYVNYGTNDDYDRLQEGKIAVEGKIILARTGEHFFGNIVRNAEMRKALAVILFYLPKNDSYDSCRRNSIPRGSVFLGLGDPYSEGFPIKKDYSEQVPNPKGYNLPRIPCLPITLDAARTLLDLFPPGHADEKNWKKGTQEAFIGPGVDAKTIKMKVHNILARGKIENVCGIIRGVLQDSFVIFGAEKDTLGLKHDESRSGIALLLELSRVFGSKYRDREWRPLRSLMFCAWDGSHMGFIGANEWVEENNNFIGDVVAYVDLDIHMKGHSLEVRASPLLASILIDALKIIPSPVREANFLYDDWRKDKDLIPIVEGRGNHAPFYLYEATPSVHFSWINDSSIACHPKDEATLDEYTDPGMSYHEASARLAAILGYILCDTPLLPYSLDTHLQHVSNSIKFISKRRLIQEMPNMIAIMNKTLFQFSKTLRRWANDRDNIYWRNRYFLPRYVSSIELLVERGLLFFNATFPNHLFFTACGNNGNKILYLPYVSEASKRYDNKRSMRLLKQVYTQLMYAFDALVETGELLHLTI